MSRRFSDGVEHHSEGKYSDSHSRYHLAPVKVDATPAAPAKAMSSGLTPMADQMSLHTPRARRALNAMASSPKSREGTPADSEQTALGFAVPAPHSRTSSTSSGASGMSMPRFSRDSSTLSRASSSAMADAPSMAESPPLMRSASVPTRAVSPPMGDEELNALLHPHDDDGLGFGRNDCSSSLLDVAATFACETTTLDYPARPCRRRLGLEPPPNLRVDTAGAAARVNAARLEDRFLDDGSGTHNAAEARARPCLKQSRTTGSIFVRRRARSDGSEDCSEFKLFTRTRSRTLVSPRLDMVDEGKVCDSPTLKPPVLSLSPTALPPPRSSRGRVRKRPNDDDMASPDLVCRSSVVSVSSMCSRTSGASLGSVASSCDSVESARMLDHYVSSDAARPKSLPCIESHSFPDLNVVSVETVADLLDGKFAEQVPNFVIVDCRYEFEYEGGHIRGAINILEATELVQRFLTNPDLSQGAPVLLFHCEFSKNRGPKMLKLLRNLDRKIHADTYPDLYYPELYLINKGYRNVYAQRPAVCEPQAYTEMSDPRFHEVQLAAHSRVKQSYQRVKCQNGRSRRKRPRSRLRRSCPDKL